MGVTLYSNCVLERWNGACVGVTYTPVTLGLKCTCTETLPPRRLPKQGLHPTLTISLRSADCKADVLKPRRISFFFQLIRLSGSSLFNDRRVFVHSGRSVRSFNCRMGLC